MQIADKRWFQHAAVITGLALLYGCGSDSTKLTVTTFGEGIVTSTPSGIDCGGGFESCSYEFTKDEIVTLTAAASDGYIFSGWGGDCTGADNCSLSISGKQTVEATFVVSGGDITPPTKPMGALHAVDATELSLAWDPSSDNVTDPSQLIYKVYISPSEDDLLAESNLAFQVLGTEDLYITKTDAIPDMEYFAAIVAVDGSLNESSPTITSTTTPVETPTMREDITIFFTDEEGWDTPQQDEAGLYRYTIPTTSPKPEIGNYIAYTSTEDNGAYQLTAAINVTEGNDHYIVEARPALLMEISDNLSFGGAVHINPGRIKLTTPEAEELAKKKDPLPLLASRISSTQSSLNTLTDSSETSIDVTPPLALPPGVKSDQAAISSVIPEPPEDCNEQPTTELNFNAYATPDLAFEYNFDAASMNICSDSLKDSDGNCPESPEDTGVISGSMVIDSSLKITLANEECLYKKYVIELEEGEVSVKRWKRFNKILKKIPGGNKVASFANQLNFKYKLDFGVVYSGTAKSSIETENTVQYRLNDMKFGVGNMLSKPKKIVDLGTPSFDVDAKADVKGDLSYDIYLVPNLTISVDALGQLKAEWKGDIQMRQFGRISAGTPDPLVPDDLYFKTYTMGAETICYDSLDISTGIFGLWLGDIVDVNYENEEFCHPSPEFFFAMPIFHSGRGLGIGEANGKQYLVTEYLYANPPLNEIDWSTAEYGIMLLNGEMINYPIIVQPTYFYSTHTQTGWSNLVAPIWSEYPVPEDVLPPGTIESTGGGQKFWLRAETKLGRYYLSLSDWQFP